MGQFNNRIASAKDIQMYKRGQDQMHKRYSKNNVKSQLHMDIVKNAQKTITLNSQTNHSGSPERNLIETQTKESFLNANGLKSPHDED
jgi:hypothetical protein